MKRIFNIIIIVVLCLLLCSCKETGKDAMIVATTLPVYEFTTMLCDGTGITVNRLVTENVSCLHDYTLQVQQMRAIEAAELLVISGAGYESFLEDALSPSNVIVDASVGIPLLACEHEGEGNHDHGHVHEYDPHIWLSPDNAKQMAENICIGLTAKYPQYSNIFSENLTELHLKLDAITSYAETQLGNLSCRDIITFHDGFEYMARAFDLHILHAVEEESGSEASASELIELIQLIRENKLPAIFTECNGSDSAAGIISSETGAEVFTLDMAVSGDSYFDAMYQNIDVLKEALE